MALPRFAPRCYFVMRTVNISEKVAVRCEVCIERISEIGQAAFRKECVPFICRVAPLPYRAVKLIIDRGFAQRGFELKMAENECLRDGPFWDAARSAA